METANLKDLEIPELKPEDMDLILESKADPRILSFYDKLGKALVAIYKQIKRPIVFPKIFPITGTVSVDDLPSVEINNFSQLESYFKSLDMRIGNLATAISMTPTAKDPIIKMPKIEIPKIEIPKNKELENTLQNIENTLKKLLNRETEFPTTISVDNFPPQMTPQPVTHMSINSLDGILNSRSITVSTVATLIPPDPIANRRTLIIYNNDATQTMYIGGSNVLPASGLPVPAGTFSPPMDAGPLINVYGIKSGSGTIDARVMEISDSASGR